MQLQAGLCSLCVLIVLPASQLSSQSLTTKPDDKGHQGSNMETAALVQGYGRLLMEEAERIAAREHRSSKLAVISGVGTRHYYRKLGFHLEGPYMVKHLASCGPRLQQQLPE